jgi:F0F1-type ATP synthase epsilon subunit
MAENIRIEVVTPEKAVVSDEAKIVVAPGSEGEFGVLIGHTPFLTTLKIGSLRYTTKMEKTDTFSSMGALPRHFLTK